jgi:Flp pilus assembly protein TadG
MKPGKADRYSITAKWRLLRNRRGTVLVEFAIAVPVLLLLLLGGIELGRFVLLNQKLNRTAMTVTDLVARVQTVDTTELDAIFAAANISMSPFEFGNRGAIVISSVKESSGLPQVIWQRSGGGTLSVASGVGAQGGNATLSDNALVDEINGIIVGEAYYEYRPWFLKLIPAAVLRQQAIFQPRQVNEITCSNC